MSVWDDLVGQKPVIETLRAAASGQGMTHAFLLTGPPGSGRSNAAIAFAAALQCENAPGPAAGCGGCNACIHAHTAGKDGRTAIHKSGQAALTESGVDRLPVRQSGETGGGCNDGRQRQ